MQLSRRSFLSTTACAIATLAVPSLVWGKTPESVSASGSASASASGSASGSASSSASTSVPATSGSTTSSSAIGSYTVGLQEHGFTLTEVGYLESIKATKLLFTHDATGAKIYFLKNDDPNRTFETVFQTAPTDDTGKLHVLEHAECAASDRYPGRDVFFYIGSNCYITDSNATTYDNATRYYAASLDAEQLAVATDFFMDCAFHSAMATDENYFKSEAWRYELNDVDADLALTGVVYSEMSGSYGAIGEVAYYDLKKALFPDTAQRFNAAGDPDVIRTLKYEDLVDFYHSAYQPSNCTTMFYGDVDVERYLKVFDEEYFAGFGDNPTTAAAMETQQPFDAPVAATFDFATSANTTSTGSCIAYATALPADIGYTNELALELIVDVLDDSSSIPMQNLYASGIGSSYAISQMYIGPQMIIIFDVADADPERADEFKQIAIDSITQTIEEGLDSDLIANAYHQVQLSEKLIMNQADVGIVFADRVAESVNRNRPLTLDPLASYDAAYASIGNGDWKELLQDQIIDNTLAALVTVTPKPGLLEEQAQRRADELAAVKAGMSDDQIADLVQATADFNEWNSTGIPDSTAQKLDVVDAATLQATVPTFETSYSEQDGIHVVTAVVDNKDVSYCRYMIDLSSFDVEQMHMLALLCELSGLSTADHTLDEVSVLMGRYLYELGQLVNASQIGDTAVPFLYISYYCMNTDAKEAAQIALETMLRTDLEDQDNLSQLQMTVDSWIQSFTDFDGLCTLATTAAYADSDALYALRTAISGPGYYTFLQDTAARLSSDPSSVVSELEDVRDKVLGIDSNYVVYEGTADTMSDTVDILIEQLKAYTTGSASASAAASATASASAAASSASAGASSAASSASAGASSAASSGCAKYIAYIANTDVAGAGVGYNITASGYTMDGASIVAAQVLTDQVMLPVFRYQYGVYDAAAYFFYDGRFQSTLYRAASYSEYIDMLSELPDALAQVSLTEDQLNSYKLPAISQFVKSSGNFADAINQIIGELRGITIEDRQALVDEVKEASADKVLATSDMLRDAISKSTCIVIASAADIAAKANLFDEEYDFQ